MNFHFICGRKVKPFTYTRVCINWELGRNIQGLKTDPLENRSSPSSQSSKLPRKLALFSAGDLHFLTLLSYLRETCKLVFAKCTYCFAHHLDHPGTNRLPDPFSPIFHRLLGHPLDPDRTCIPSA